MIRADAIMASFDNLKNNPVKGEVRIETIIILPEYSQNFIILLLRGTREPMKNIKYRIIEVNMKYSEMMPITYE